MPGSKSIVNYKGFEGSTGPCPFYRRFDKDVCTDALQKNNIAARSLCRSRG